MTELSPEPKKKSGLPQNVGVLLEKITTTFFRRMVFIERKLFPPPEPANLPFEVEIRELALPDEIAALRIHRPKLSEKIIRARIEQGSRCFTAWHRARIVHSNWAAANGVFVPYLHRNLRLEKRTIFLFDSYTHPHYRQLGIARNRAVFQAELFAREGFKRSIGLVAIENGPGNAVPVALGYRIIGRFISVGLGRFNYVWSTSLEKTPIPHHARR